MMIKKTIELLLKPHIIFLFISLIVGWFFILLNPPLWGLDEPAHFARSYQAAKGQMLPDTSTKNYGGNMPDNYIAINWYRGADIHDEKYSSGTSVLQRQDVSDKNAYNKILAETFTKSEHNFHWTAMYSPAAYPGPIAGISIAQALNFTIGQTFFIAKLFSLFVYTAVCFLAVWIIRQNKTVWLFVIIALLPTALFQATVVTSDNVLIALTLLFFALYIRLLIGKNTRNIEKRLMFALLIVGVLLPLIKINYIFISLTLLALPAVYFKSISWQIIYKTGGALASVVLGLLWMRLSGASNTPPQSQRSDLLPVNPSEQMHFVIQHPLDFLMAMVKSIIIYGDNSFNGIFFTISGIGVDIPIILMFILVVTLVIAALYAKSDLLKIKKQVIYLAAASLIVSVSIFGALYVVFNPVGWWFIDGVQGRYFTPFVLPFIMVLTIFLPIKLSVSKRFVKTAVISVAVICLAVSVVYDYLAFY